MSSSELLSTVPADARETPREVTIVANDIGPVGGMERVLTELITGLSASGVRVTVIARTFEVPPLPGVTFHRVRGPRRPALLAYPWFMLAGSLALRRWRRGIVQSTGAIVLGDIDVVSVHYCHQVGPANPSRANRRYRVHSMLVRAMARAGERLCFTRYRHATFACVSAGVAEEVRAHYPQIASRVIVIHNGVDPGSFSPGRHAADADALRVRLGIERDSLLALFVGSEWDGKGLAELLRALSLLERWELVIVGRGDRVRFEALARELGVARRVHWIGVTSEVAALYELADAFVLPSTYETFSLVTFEAAASGVPVLATPVSGVSELIDDGENGYVISRDPETIAERLRTLAEDAGLRDRLGAEARRAALNFTWEKMVAAHLELYARLEREQTRAPASR